MRLKLLGISGAHREGRRNTVYALEEALYAAQDVADVDAEILELKDKRIDFCEGCDQCMGRKNARGEIMELYGCKIRDDMQWIYPKLVEQDGIIFGSPVHILGMSSRLKAFIDRQRWIVHQGRLRWTVAGVITVAYLPIGGQESCSQEILNAVKGFQMIYTGFAHGGTLVSGPTVGGPTPWDDDGEAISVDKDRWGLRAARYVGRMVAETALVVKTGREVLGDAAMARLTVPYHKLPKVPGHPDGAPPIPRSERPPTPLKSRAHPARRVIIGAK